jgi:AcrR family transcriptional regulator
MTEFSGRADPDRILPLLWRHRTAQRAKTGRPPRLTVDAVVAAAIALADEDGLEATSMARLAARLEVATMTLYTYVPSRAELVDLMVDDVLTSRALPGPAAPRPADWRDQVFLYAERTRAAYVAHPWLAQVSTVRPPIGPGMLADREYVLSTVAGLGLAPGRVDEAAIAIAGFVTSAARFDAESAQLLRASGQTTDAWWAQRTRLWEDYFEADEHPTMNRLWTAGGFDRGTVEQARDAFAFGLRALLDGIEAAADMTGLPRFSAAGGSQSSETTGLRSSPMP